jgi:two-component system, NtrC family, C4-dicarboxylate transport response regulator DctD
MSPDVPVLFVDDEEPVREAARQTLELAGCRVEVLASAEAALKLVSSDWPGIVVADVRMPRMDGRELMRRCLEIDPDLPVVLVTGHGDISMAVQAMRDGAYDFVEKPFRSELLIDVVNRAIEKRLLVLENRQLRSALDSRQSPEELIIGSSPAIRAVHQAIHRLAGADVDVLITGETGTGKELVARCLHQQSSRASAHFVAINCGAVPEGIFESELFGHEAGAFTGAESRRIGKLEHAGEGTLFLDEVESLPLHLQVKVLRALQERVIERLGSNEARHIDIRVLAATKSDLRAASDNGTFRADLFYRLDVARIELPPLAERREDIPLLFRHFLLRASSRYGREAPAVSRETLHELTSRAWPGNVRELRNAAHRYVLSGALDHHPADSGRRASAEGLAEQVEAFERDLIASELSTQKGSVKATYEALGLPRKTLYEKMRKHGLDRRDFLDNES